MTPYEALAVDNRRKIITLLSQNDTMTATDICQEFSISAPAVSQHLKVLHEARLVTFVKNGQKRLYRLDLNGIREIDTWLQDVKREWAERLDNLNAYVKKIQNKGDN